jgi:hypothetical protein
MESDIQRTMSIFNSKPSHKLRAQISYEVLVSNIKTRFMGCGEVCCSPNGLIAASSKTPTVRYRRQKKLQNA